MYLTEYDEAEHMRLIEIEKQREFEEIRTETQDAYAKAIPIALRLIREGATTVKELTDHGIPEKIAKAFFDDKDLISEGKCDKDE